MASGEADLVTHGHNDAAALISNMRLAKVWRRWARPRGTASRTCRRSSSPPCPAPTRSGLRRLGVEVPKAERDTIMAAAV